MVKLEKDPFSQKCWRNWNLYTFSSTCAGKTGKVPFFIWLDMSSHQSNKSIYLLVSSPITGTGILWDLTTGGSMVL